MPSTPLHQMRMKETFSVVVRFVVVYEYSRSSVPTRGASSADLFTFRLIIKILPMPCVQDS